MKFELLAQFKDNNLVVKINDTTIKNNQVFCVKNDFGKLSYQQINSQSFISKLKIKNPKIGFLFFIVKNDHILVIPDDWGRVPLFFHHSYSELFCSSSFKSVIENYNLEIDDNEILKQLFFGHSFLGKTIFKNTFVLPPYNKIFFYKSGTKLKNNILEIKNIADSKKYSISKINEMISRVFNDYFKMKTNFLLSISGGLDSRLLLAKYLELKQKKLNCFTYGTKNDRDVIIAKKITKDLNLKHKIFNITPNNFIKNLKEYLLFCGGTSAITNSRAFDIYKSFDSKNTIINGFGGDLTFGGGFHKRDLIENRSNKFFIDFLINKFSKIEFFEFINLFGLTRQKLKYIIKSEIRNVLKVVGDNGSLALKFDKILLLSKATFSSYWSVLFSAQKAKVITPLFDPRLNNFFLSIDPRVRYKHSLYKKYFIEKYPKFSNYPWQKFAVNLYDSVDQTLLKKNINRRIPYQKFFSKNLKSWIDRLIFSKDSYLIRLVNKDALKKIINRKNGDNNWADFIGQLISIEFLIKIIKEKKYD